MQGRQTPWKSSHHCDQIERNAWLGTKPPSYCHIIVIIYVDWFFESNQPFPIELTDLRYKVSTIRCSKWKRSRRTSRLVPKIIFKNPCCGGTYHNREPADWNLLFFKNLNQRVRHLRYQHWQQEKRQGKYFLCSTSIYSVHEAIQVVWLWGL